MSVHERCDPGVAGADRDPAVPDAGDTGFARPERVLVVDDSEANRYATAHVLAAAGYDVITAASGREALRLAHAHLPAVVVLDVLMPDLMGWEVCAALKRDPATAAVSVLEVSASYTTDADRVHGLNDGADSYLTQPIDPAVLLATVRALLRLHDAAQAARRSEERLRTLLANAPVLLFAVDRAGVYTLFTGSPADAGLPPDVLGRTVDEVNAGDERALGNARRALAGHALVDEMRLGSRWFQVRYRPVRDARGGRAGFVAVATDVTERRRAERMREELLAIVAHDLRAPLTGIQLNIDVLRRALAGAMSAPVAPAEVLSRMGRSVERASRLIADLLDHSKIEAGTFRIERAAHDPAALLREAIDAMTPLAREKEIALALDAPDCGPLECDAARVVQATCNLIDNAIKASPRRSTVRLALRQAPNAVTIAIEDEGPGIPAEELPRLFERFWQGAAGTKQGAGLGLAIAAGIVAAHGGSVHADNCDSGARFILRLPR